MNKFKFGDRVNVASPHWKSASDVGVVIGSNDGLNNIQFENGGYTGLVPDEFVTLATDWVKCGERMPELDVPVLVVDQNGIDLGVIYDGDDWFLADAEREITHWMPLPTPPTEVER